MKSETKTLLAATVVSILLGQSTSALANEQHNKHQPVFINQKVNQTDAVLRDLWLSHSFWVRAVVIETLDGNAAAAAAAETEVVNNAKQLAASMEAFYGKPAADQVYKLLVGHYTAVKQYLLATRDHNAAEQAAAQQAMFNNADKIAIFLSNANPHLPIDSLRGMLVAHGAHHVTQIQQIADKKYSQEAKTWEAMKNHMYGIADALTYAIAKQFPAKFK